MLKLELELLIFFLLRKKMCLAISHSKLAPDKIRMKMLINGLDAKFSVSSEKKFQIVTEKSTKTYTYQ